MPPLSFENIKDKITVLTQQVFDTKGMELVELTVKGHPRDIHIEIIADKPSGGINIRECAILNKNLVAAIEQENFLPLETFSLELSSPGLDRPLVTRKDFKRVINQNLNFWFNMPVEGKLELQSILMDVGDDCVYILGADNKDIRVPLSVITKGLLVIE